MYLQTAMLMYLNGHRACIVHGHAIAPAKSRGGVLRSTAVDRDQPGGLSSFASARCFA